MSNRNDEFKSIVFQLRKFKPYEETMSDFFTHLQRLATTSFPDVAAVAAHYGRAAVASEDRAKERTRRVREAKKTKTLSAHTARQYANWRTKWGTVPREDDQDTAFTEILPHSRTK